MPDAINIYEIAYGHHRLIALQELKIEEIDIPIRDLSEEQMAKIMVNENMEEWENSATIEQESIRTVIEGYASDRLKLPLVKRGKAYMAPHFQPLDSGGDEGPVYTVASLAEFLGWPEPKIESVIQALAVIEKGWVEEKDFTGLTSYQAGVIASQVQRVGREVKNPDWVRSFAKDLSGGMRADRSRGAVVPSDKKEAQSITTKNAKFVADQFISRAVHQTFLDDKKKAKKLPPLDVFVGSFTQYLYEQPPKSQQDRLYAILEHKEHVHPRTRDRMIKALRSLAKKYNEIANEMENVEDQQQPQENNQSRKIVNLVGNSN
jgi:hypothetical protein